MNKKNIQGESFAKGFNATQAGGALGPDAAEKFFKNIFSKEPTAKPEKKEPVAKKEPKVKKEPPKATTIRNFNDIPDMLSYKDHSGMLFTYDKNKRKWISRDGKTELDPKDGAVGYNKAREKSRLESEDTTMKKAVKEGLADLAHKAEADHEVQMARADLYKIAKYAIKLHDMLKSVSEEQGLEGWQQAKITKAADYMSSVFHNLDYEMKFGQGSSGSEMEIKMGEAQDDPELKSAHDAGYKDASRGKKKNPHNPGSPLAKEYDKGQDSYKRHFGESNDPYKQKLAARLEEKAKSKAQQRFMGMVYAAKKGEKPASPDVAKVAKGMSKKSAKDYASTKHKGKPEHVKKD